MMSLTRIRHGKDHDAFPQGPTRSTEGISVAGADMATDNFGCS